jgi:hypothetical protein
VEEEGWGRPWPENGPKRYRIIIRRRIKEIE